jgi:hypothetical protein
MSTISEKAAKFQYERTFGKDYWERASAERKAAWVRSMEPLVEIIQARYIRQRIADVLNNRTITDQTKCEQIAALIAESP